MQEHLKFCIERFDHYYDSVNNKSTVFLAVNTFIVGGLVASYSTIQAAFNCNYAINSLIVMILINGLVSIFITLRASIPFLSEPDNSLLYFGSIASRNLDAFKEAISQSNPGELQIDYAEQVHILATGLNSKFKKLQQAGFLIIAEFTLAIPLIILLLTNVKK